MCTKLLIFNKLKVNKGDIRAAKNSTAEAYARKKNNKGLSQVVTTLILLVVSVLLAGVVTYYATNMIMVRTENEVVVMMYAHVWVNDSDHAQAAFYLKNVGGRDILLDKITIRGIDTPWSSVHFNRSTASSDLTWVGNYSTLTDDPTDDVPMASSGNLIVYIDSPDNIQLEDIGTTVSIAVFSMNGQWIKEVNVEYSG